MRKVNENVNADALTTEDEKHDKKYMKDLMNEVESTANQNPETQTLEEKYEAVLADAESLKEENENLQALVKELQANIKETNLTGSGVGNDEFELLKNFYTLVGKHIQWDSDSGVYRIEVAFAGPKGKATITECKKRFH